MSTEPQSSEAVSSSQLPEVPVVSPEPAVTSEAAQQVPEPALEAEPPRKKVQLNPTADPASLKAVPTLGESSTPPAPPMPVKMPDAHDAEVEAAIQQAVAAHVPEAVEKAPQSAPVELPPAEDVELDVDAAIAAAMSGGALATPVLNADELQPGAKLQGTVVSVNAESVFLDLGQGKTGAVASRQFPNGKLPEPGTVLDVVFERADEEEGLIIANLPRAISKTSADWDLLIPGQIVECMVTKTNKGGLDVTVGSLRAFLPASQVDMGFIADLAGFVNQKLRVKVMEVKPEKRRLVVSRRQILIEERQVAEKEMYEKLQPDEILTGRVKTIKEYGAFVDLGGVDGFLPIGQISWLRIGHPSEVIQEGQEIEVKVTGIDRDKKKISLSTRQLAPNPWKQAESKYEKGSTVIGRVTRLEAFGAFVELEPGIEGLVHISELDHRRVKRVSEVLNVGDMAEVQVVEVEPGRKRISLSVKALKAKPEPVAPPADEDLAPGKGQSYERKNKGNLKGGIGGSGKGGLFGNPSDFGR